MQGLAGQWPREHISYGRIKCKTRVSKGEDTEVKTQKHIQGKMAKCLDIMKNKNLLKSKNFSNFQRESPIPKHYPRVYSKCVGKKIIKEVTQKGMLSIEGP